MSNLIYIIHVSADAYMKTKLWLLILTSMYKKHTAVAVVLTDLCYFEGISKHSLKFIHFSSWKNN